LYSDGIIISILKSIIAIGASKMNKNYLKPTNIMAINGNISVDNFQGGTFYPIEN
jgi:hypothetical protein